MPSAILTTPPPGSVAPGAHRASHISGGSDAFLSTDALEAAAMRLRETSGPTILALGAVADGQALVRSASTLIGSSVVGDMDVLSVQTGVGGTITYTVPANTLAANGDALLIIAGASNATANDAISVKFGGTTLHSCSPGINSGLLFVGVIVRTGASAQYSFGYWSASQGGENGGQATAALNLAANQDLVVQGTVNTVPQALWVAKVRAA